MPFWPFCLAQIARNSGANPTPMRRMPSIIPVVASTRKIAMAFVSDANQTLRVSSSHFEISKEISILKFSPKSTTRKGISRCSKSDAVIVPLVNSFLSLRDAKSF